MPASSSYHNEAQMYPDVAGWLKTFLEGRFPKTQVDTYDTHSISLGRFVYNQGLGAHFPLYATFDIKVDITGIIRPVQAGSPVRLAFVECKIGPIILRDIGQILGYSRVARPAYALIVSPAGLSQPLGLLLGVHRRYDVLEYDRNVRVKVAVWDPVRKAIDFGSLLPPGEHF